MEWRLILFMLLIYFSIYSINVFMKVVFFYEILKLVFWIICFVFLLLLWFVLKGYVKNFILRGKVVFVK